MERQRSYPWRARATLALCVFAANGPAMGRSDEPSVLICSRINAKQMPQGFSVEAMPFTGPAGDGRRGSAGFVVPAAKLLKGPGTRLTFIFQRDPSGGGFQIIHPWAKGHVLVSIHSGVSLHRGGTWRDHGWGDPATSDDVETTKKAAKLLPLKASVKHRVASELAVNGEYRLWINDQLICRHKIVSALPLILESSAGRSVWAGSSWNRTQFAGPDFHPQLRPGHAGLILGPMDGSGPRQNFQEVTLSRPAAPSARHFEPLFAHIDQAREFDKLARSPVAGAAGGGPFVEIPAEPSVLIGLEYATSRLYGGHLTVKAIRPIFLGRGGESLGSWHGVPHGTTQTVKAKGGYAVAGIVAKSGHRVDGIRVIFMQVKSGRLNPDETYRSEWLGGQGGGAESLYAANGDPIVGLHGRQGHDLDALGFVQAATR